MIYFQSTHAISRPTFRRFLIRQLVRLILIYTIGKYFVYRLYLHPANQLPGPPPDLIPFVGHFRQLLSKDAGVTHRAWAKKYGNVFRYFAGGNHPRILIADADAVKQILTSNEFDFIKPPETKQFLTLFLGDGILVTEGDVHRYQRKMLNPTFGLSALRDMIPLMVAPTQQLVHQWNLQCSHGQPTEIIVSRGLGLLTLEIIGLAGFGQRFDCIRYPERNAFSKAYLDLLSGDSPVEALLAMMFPWLHRLPAPRAWQVRKDMEMLHREVQAMVNMATQRTDIHEKKDLLALMIRQVDDETGKSLTAKELQDQCLTFLAAGHETTSVAVSWALHTLAYHQDIQDKLRKEIQQTLPQDISDDAFSYDDINQLPFLNNVCKEVLRFTPPVPMTNRIAIKDFQLQNKSFPKGTRVVICPMVSHFDKAQWGDDCDEFIPSRWDHAPANNISPYVYLPFLAGGRQCIGYRFALIEFKVVLALLIRQFKFTPKPGFKVRKGLQITLRPLPNMTLMVEKVPSV
ncbi:cytochrome P450 [Halteromyces radiatus]|uniref:cytochrome P450 n=1 Tax=Halteromyces radiatus TaxID=101107 RepID=UPI00221E3FFB|nr:cytochrome P450 [Halteromyces radiatus]KAI8089267.1 cytochrome P450 [Halteromyces radiatus]